MDGLDIAAFVVMGLLVAIAVGVFLWLARLPGRVARDLDHPYVQAISVGGWVTLRVSGENIGWPALDSYLYAESSPVWFGEVGSTDPAVASAAAEKLLMLLDVAEVKLKAGYILGVQKGGG